ncbi:MAG: glycosyltransferase, partial [Pseudomonadota bacterium]
MVEHVPRCLDLTRLSRRAGRTLTGVDRVELAYLKRLLKSSDVIHGLVRTRLGFLLLDRSGMAVFDQLLATGTWAKAGIVPRMIWRDPVRRNVEASLRKLAIARCRPRNLRQMLTQNLPAGVHYLNIAHSNITNKILAAFAAVPRCRIGVMIHDTIPLDYPQYQRIETPDQFRRQLKAVSGLADVVIANSAQTAKDVERHLVGFGHVPDIVTAHLGHTPAKPDLSFETPKGPFFVSVGTIEPRKNHALLLEIWNQLAQDLDAPKLVICGGRGWRNDDVFGQLDRKPANVIECNDLTDQQIATLLTKATGLLMPSFAEGYG